MRQLHHTSRAHADLIDIWLFVGAESPRAADRQLDAIHGRLQRLLEYPHTGSLREDIGPGIRRVVIGQYLAFYRVTADTVDVLRVLHGKRRIDRDTVM